jgi:hypothetical protein
MSHRRAKPTNLQVRTSRVLYGLDDAKRELTAEEYEWLLDIVATRIARDIVNAALNERRAA